MANLVDASFFVGEINIPNTSKPEVAESLNLFITKYEKELLKQLFGYELFKSYELDSTTQRFQDLIQGKDNWRGLVWNTNHSMIANYIYTWWLKDKLVWNSGIGTSRAKGDRSEVMPISFKMTEAWNEFSTQVGEFITFMEDNNEIYEEWAAWDLWQFAPINEFDI